MPVCLAWGESVSAAAREVSGCGIYAPDSRQGNCVIKHLQILLLLHLVLWQDEQTVSVVWVEQVTSRGSVGEECRVTTGGKFHVAKLIAEGTHTFTCIFQYVHVGHVNECVSSMHLHVHVYLGISGSKKDKENQLVEYIANELDTDCLYQ